MPPVLDDGQYTQDDYTIVYRRSSIVEKLMAILARVC